MLLFAYESLSVDPLKNIKISLQLADNSTVYPNGALEIFLVKVNYLIFPADFYVIYREVDNSLVASNILLGQSFLSIERTQIDILTVHLL